MFNRTAKLTGMMILALMLTGCVSSGGIDPAVGNWDVVTVSALGTAEQTIVINGDMTGMLKAQGQDFTLRNVVSDSGVLTFDVTFSIQGTDIPAKFTGNIDGDAIKGELVTQFGNASVTGNRGS
ncbi:MAG: hypothetical protein AAF525_13635 [Pseudomonadota bacterium]